MIVDCEFRIAERDESGKQRPRVKSESGNHESTNCLSWVSWLPDENTTNCGLRDCESRKVGHQGITLRSLHPPPPSSSADYGATRATAWQEIPTVVLPRNDFPIPEELGSHRVRSFRG